MRLVIILSLVTALLTMPATSTYARGFGDPADHQSTASVSRVHLLPTVHRDEPADAVWSEDFENGAGNWTTHDAYDYFWAWHKTNFNEREGQGLAWWCGDTLTAYPNSPVGYDSQWLQFIKTPALDLSGAAAGLKLTFDGWWLLEDARIKPPTDGYHDGWDGFLVLISTDGGNSFEPLYPDSPDYTAQHLSASDRWWHVGDWPGWTFCSMNGDWPDPDKTQRPNVDWVDCTFDLSDYKTDNVVIWWCLVSDRRVAAPYPDVNGEYLQQSGVMIDNVLVKDNDGTVFLSNNADDDPVPSDLVMGVYPGWGGDHWQLTDANSHSGTWSMWNDDDYRRCLDALDTPPISLPDGYNLWLEFWVRCDMPDYDSEPDSILDDFWQLMISSDSGRTWEYFAHDYDRPEAGGDNWSDYIPGVHWDPNVTLDLSDWAGQTIQLRWLFRTDADDNGGNGSGLFLDDIQVMGTNRNNRDVGMGNLHLPYPTTVGHRTTDISVMCYNYGVRDLQAITSRWAWTDGLYGKYFPIRPNLDLASDEFDTLYLSDLAAGKPKGWTPTMPGVISVGARTTLGMQNNDPSDDDENPANDSVRVDDVRVWPNPIYELGYDNRTIKYSFNFDPSEGAAVRFTPADVDTGDYSLAWVRFQFNGLQNEVATFTLHVLGDGDDTTPGGEIFNMDVDVPRDSLNPNFMTVPLSTYNELRGLSGDFWIWAEIQRDDHWPQMVGDDPLRGAGHYFSYDGNTAAAYNFDLMVQAAIIAGSNLTPNVAGSGDGINFGEVIEGENAIESYSLYCAGLTPVTITSVTSHDPFIVYWPGETTLNPGEAVTFDVMFAPQDASEHLDSLVITSNDTTPPVPQLVGLGAAGVGSDRNVAPVRFALNAPYPNPFNSVTRISFGLDRASDAGLILYDLNGREVRTLVTGHFTAGRHGALLNAEGLPAGIYMLKLTAGEQQAVRKVVLVK